MVKFGDAEEFNNFGWGWFVYPYTTLGLRPTFRVGLGVGGGAGGFFASPYPAMANYIQSGFVWLTSSPFTGSVVVTDIDEPLNVIASVPYLVSAPVDLIPSYPSQITKESWEAAGLDRVRQAPLWMLPDGNTLGVIVNLQAQGFLLTPPGPHIKVGPAIASAIHPHTEGLELEPLQGFAKISHSFALLPYVEKFLPQGDYKFRIDLTIIPRSLAHRCGNLQSEAECYRNVHLSEGTAHPTTSVEVLGQMPAPFPIPTVQSIGPISGAANTPVELSGTLLATTQDVWFSHEARSSFSVFSDNLVRATCPPTASTGVVTVETARGFANSPMPFEVNGGTEMAANDVRVE